MMRKNPCNSVFNTLSSLLDVFVNSFLLELGINKLNLWKYTLGPNPFNFILAFCLYHRSDPHFDPVPELSSFDAVAEHNRFVLEIV